MSDRFELFLTCPKGLEGLLIEEAVGLGLEEAREHTSAVRGMATMETAYRLCLWSRLANRVLFVLKRFPMKDAEDLYHGVLDIDWADHMVPDGSLAVEFSGHGSGIDNTHFGALKVKDAIVDKLRTPTGERPSIDKINPDLRIKTFPQGVSPANVNAFLDGVDLAIDAMDVFAVDMHPLLVNAATAKGLTTIAAVPPLWLQLAELDWPHDAAAQLERLTGALEPDDIVYYENEIAPDVQVGKKRRPKPGETLPKTRPSRDSLQGAAGETSACVRERVLRARRHQTTLNARLAGDLLAETLDEPSRRFLRQAGERMALSARAYHRVLRVARTIADLHESGAAQRTAIAPADLAEALAYRGDGW